MTLVSHYFNAAITFNTAHLLAVLPLLFNISTPPLPRHCVCDVLQQFSPQNTKKSEIRPKNKCIPQRTWSKICTEVKSMGERTQPILFGRVNSGRVLSEDEDRTLVEDFRGRHNPLSQSISWIDRFLGVSTTFSLSSLSPNSKSIVDPDPKTCDQTCTYIEH